MILDLICDCVSSFPECLLSPSPQRRNDSSPQRWTFQGIYYFRFGWLTHTLEFFIVLPLICFIQRFLIMIFFTSHDLYMLFLRKKCFSSNTTFLMSTHLSLKSKLVRNLLWEAFQAPHSHLIGRITHTPLCYQGVLTQTSVVHLLHYIATFSHSQRREMCVLPYLYTIALFSGRKLFSSLY